MDKVITDLIEMRLRQSQKTISTAWVFFFFGIAIHALLTIDLIWLMISLVLAFIEIGATIYHSNKRRKKAEVKASA